MKSLGTEIEPSYSFQNKVTFRCSSQSTGELKTLCLYVYKILFTLTYLNDLPKESR